MLRMRLANITDKIRWLINRNQEIAQLYEEQTEVRNRYIQQKRTAFASSKCMDGRVNLFVILKCLVGFIKPFRRAGAKMRLGWPSLGVPILKWIKKMVDAGRPVLFLATYHYSEGNVHRGCAGFNYDTAAAKKSAEDFKEQMDQVFDSWDADIHCIVIGIETDDEAIILHNSVNDLPVIKFKGKSNDEIMQVLRVFYPELSERIIIDLAERVIGNLEHIDEVKESRPEPEALEHNEWIVAFGSGFDWLHTINTALIINNIGFEIENDLKIAFGVIKGNMEKGHISDDGFILLISWSREKELYDERLELEFLSDLERLAIEVLQKHFPELLPKVHPLLTIVDDESKRFIYSKESFAS